MADIPGIRYTGRESPWRLAQQDPNQPIRLAQAQAAQAAAHANEARKVAGARTQGQIDLINANLKRRALNIQAKQQRTANYLNLFTGVANIVTSYQQNKGTAQAAAASMEYQTNMVGIHDQFENRPLFIPDPQGPNPDGTPRMIPDDTWEDDYRKAEAEIRQKAGGRVTNTYGQTKFQADMQKEQVKAEKWLVGSARKRIRETDRQQLTVAIDSAIAEGNLQEARGLYGEGMNTGVIDYDDGVKGLNEINRTEVNTNFKVDIGSMAHPSEGPALRERVQEDPTLTLTQKQARLTAIDVRIRETHMELMDRIYQDTVDKPGGHDLAMAKLQGHYDSLLAATNDQLGITQGERGALLAGARGRLTDYKAGYNEKLGGRQKQNTFNNFDQGVRVAPTEEDANKHGEEWFAEQATEEGYGLGHYQEDVMDFANDQKWLPKQQRDEIANTMATGNTNDRVAAANLIEGLRDLEGGAAWDQFKPADKANAYELSKRVRGTPEDQQREIDRLDRIRTQDPNLTKARKDNYDDVIEPNLEESLLSAIDDDEGMIGAASNWWDNVPDDVSGQVMLDYEDHASSYALSSSDEDTVATMAYEALKRDWSPTTMYGNSTPILEKNSVAAKLSGGQDQPWHREAWNETFADINESAALDLDPSEHRSEYLGTNAQGMHQWYVTDMAGDLVEMRDENGTPFAAIHTPVERQVESKATENTHKEIRRAATDAVEAQQLLNLISEAHGARSDADLVSMDDMVIAQDPDLRATAEADDMMMANMLRDFNASTVGLDTAARGEADVDDMIDAQVRFDMRRLDEIYGENNSEWTPATRQRNEALLTRYRTERFNQGEWGDYNPIGPEGVFPEMMDAPFH